MNYPEHLPSVGPFVMNLAAEIQSIWDAHPLLVLAAAFGMLLAVGTFVLYALQVSTLRKLRLEVKSLQDQQPLADHLIARITSDELDDHPIIEELRTQLAAETVRRLNLARSSPESSELWRALAPKLDELIVREANLLARRAGDQIGERLTEPLVDATLERLQQASSDRQSTLRAGLNSVLDNLIVQRAAELGDSLQLQYELQDKLSEDLAGEVFIRLQSARRDRDRDPLWAQANPVFDGLIVEVLNKLTPEELAPKLIPLLEEYASERVRSGKGIPVAAENFLARMLAQVVVHCQDDLKARLKEMVQSALTERAARALPELVDRGFAQTKREIAAAVRDESVRAEVARRLQQRQSMAE